MYNSWLLRFGQGYVSEDDSDYVPGPDVDNAEEETHDSYDDDKYSDARYLDNNGHGSQLGYIDTTNIGHLIDNPDSFLYGDDIPEKP